MEITTFLRVNFLNPLLTNLKALYEIVPILIGFVVTVFLGLIIGKSLYVLTVFLLRTVKFDLLIQKLGLMEHTEKMVMDIPAQLLL